MLEIVIPEKELWDESKEEFTHTKAQTLRMEHSLVSLSKWESKWKKAFLSKKEKTYEETIDYIRCMTVTQNVDPDVYKYLSAENIKQINEYLEEEGMVDNSNINYFDEEGNIDMYKAIDLLDIYQKNVVVLFYFYNLTYKEVGDILDMNESTVKMYLRNSLKIMKEIIKEGGLHGKEEL